MREFEVQNKMFFVKCIIKMHFPCLSMTGYGHGSMDCILKEEMRIRVFINTS